MTRQTSIQLTPATKAQVDALKAAGFGTFTEIVRIAIDRMAQQEERKMKRSNLTDNAWVARVDQLNQMVDEEYDAGLSSPEAFADWADSLGEYDKDELRVITKRAEMVYEEWAER